MSALEADRIRAAYADYLANAQQYPSDRDYWMAKADAIRQLMQTFGID